MDESNNNQNQLEVVGTQNQGLATFRPNLGQGDFSALAAYKFEVMIKGQVADLEKRRDLLAKEQEEARKVLDNEIKSLAKTTKPHFYEALPSAFATFGLTKDKVTVKPILTRDSDTNELKIAITYTLSLKCDKDTKLSQSSGYNMQDYINLTSTVTLTATDKVIALSTDHENLSKESQKLTTELEATRSKLHEIASVERAARAILVTSELDRTSQGRALITNIDALVSGATTPATTNQG